MLKKAWLFASLLSAQTPAILENTGAPIHVAFTCTEEDTREAGLTCSEEQPCAVYLELSGADSLLNKTFVAGNLHTADATLYSILLGTADGGKTWTEPHPRSRFTSLDQIQFIDFETGWVSGWSVQGVPHDPFLLVTTDGGQYWRERPVFDENRNGIIERFWFDSKTNGTLWMDTKLRHELYETNTGGDSWSLRQSSKSAIQSSRLRAASESATRLRADPKTHSYHVEKHQAGKWVGIATFAVDAGKCRN